MRVLTVALLFALVVLASGDACENEDGENFDSTIQRQLRAASDDELRDEILKARHPLREDFKEKLTDTSVFDRDSLLWLAEIAKAYLFNQYGVSCLVWDPQFQDCPQLYCQKHANYCARAKESKDPLSKSLVRRLAEEDLAGLSEYYSAKGDLESDDELVTSNAKKLGKNLQNMQKELDDAIKAKLDVIDREEARLMEYVNERQELEQEKAYYAQKKWNSGLSEHRKELLKRFMQTDNNFIHESTQRTARGDIARMVQAITGEIGDDIAQLNSKIDEVRGNIRGLSIDVSRMVTEKPSKLENAWAALEGTKSEARHYGDVERNVLWSRQDTRMHIRKRAQELYHEHFPDATTPDDRISRVVKNVESDDE